MSLTPYKEAKYIPFRDKKYDPFMDEVVLVNLGPSHSWYMTRWQMFLVGCSIQPPQFDHRTLSYNPPL